MVQQDPEDRLERIAVAIAVSSFAVIARRMKAVRDDKMTYADVYATMPADIAAIEAVFRKGSSKMQSDITDIFDDMATESDEWAKPYYDAAKVKQMRAAANASMKPILMQGEEQAREYVRKHVSTSVVGIVSRDGELLSLQDAYKRAITGAVTNMATGIQNYQNAVSDAVKTLSNSGLKVFYPDEYVNKAGETVTRDKTLTRDLYASVRMNVMDTYNSTMNELRLRQGAEFGADGVMVTAHVPCAPDHEEFQGKRYSWERYREIQESLDRKLVTGWNCHHRVNPVILGVSAHTYTPKQIERMNRESRENVTVTGLSGKELTMTRYEASQYQRSIENSLRSANTERYIADQAGQDTSAIDAAIKERMTSYRLITRQAGLTTRMERTKAYTIS